MLKVELRGVMEVRIETSGHSLDINNSSVSTKSLTGKDGMVIRSI